MHVSFMRRTTAPDTDKSPLFAYERQFTRLHMKKVFGLTQDQVRADAAAAV
jgi:hypothetical protein